MIFPVSPLAEINWISGIKFSSYLQTLKLINNVKKLFSALEMFSASGRSKETVFQAHVRPGPSSKC